MDLCWWARRARNGDPLWFCPPVLLNVEEYPDLTEVDPPFEVPLAKGLASSDFLRFSTCMFRDFFSSTSLLTLWWLLFLRALLAGRIRFS